MKNGLFGLLGKKKEKAFEPAPLKVPKYTPDQMIQGFRNNGKTATYFYDDVSLFRPNNMDFVKAEPGTYLRFKREPENPYDADAIMVTDPDGGALGYLNRGKLRDMVRDFDSRWEDTVSGIVLSADGDVKIALSFIKRNRKKVLKEMEIEDDE